MLFRRIVSLALCASILHLRVAERVSACTHADGGGHDAHAMMDKSAHGAMDMGDHSGMDMSAMSMDGHEMPATTHQHVEVDSNEPGPDSTPPCELPGTCRMMATCSNPTVQVSTTATRAIELVAAHSFVDSSVMPSSRITGPEPPPPKA